MDDVQAEILKRLDRIESRDEIRQLISKYSIALDMRGRPSVGARCAGRDANLMRAPSMRCFRHGRTTGIAAPAPLEEFIETMRRGNEIRADRVR